MKNFLLYIWQLPQNLLGLLVIFFSKGERQEIDEYIFYVTDYNFGVSLGNYIILNDCFFNEDLFHEYGHQKQSLFLGPLYLLLIGLPSALGNIYDRVAHKKWNWKDREKWYYSQPWEKWADKLGRVERL